VAKTASTWLSSGPDFSKRGAMAEGPTMHGREESFKESAFKCKIPERYGLINGFHAFYFETSIGSIRMASKSLGWLIGHPKTARRAS
jgi:hypothetical protein